MIPATAKLICALAGLYCLLAVADRAGRTDPMWTATWPKTLLPRRASAAEVRAADLEARIQAVNGQIAETRDSLNAGTERRHDLVKQLRDRLGQSDETVDLVRLQVDNPVGFALVRSIDAEERRQAEYRQDLAELEGQLAQLEARQIAASNGVSLTDAVEPARPSDELRTETGEESAEIRYRRIIRDAKNVH
jgi:uncharacterized coiled-coil protein SlyX